MSSYDDLLFLARHLFFLMGDLRSRSWCLTGNYDSDASKRDLVAGLHGCGSSYFCYGEEVAPSTGQQHLQGYVRFSNAKKFSVVQRLLLGFHLTVSNGSPAQNIAYCAKTRVSDAIPNDIFVEVGERPAPTGQAGGRANADKWDNILVSAKAGKLEDIEAEDIIKYYSTIRRIGRDFLKRKLDLDAVCGVWYYGVTGTGKSFAAREEFAGAYLKLPNKWWDGYQDEEFVLIEDFDKKHDCLGYHLKIWADRYSFNGEVKGSTVSLRPKKVVVTSNYHPNQIWTDSDTLDPIMRRFHVTKFVSLGVRVPDADNVVILEADRVAVAGFQFPPVPESPLYSPPSFHGSLSVQHDDNWNYGLDGFE